MKSYLLIDPTLSIPTVKAKPLQLSARTTGNAIIIGNVPSNANVEVYNLQGKRIHAGRSTADAHTVYVQSKGIYFIRVEKQTLRIVVQ